MALLTAAAASCFSVLMVTASPLADWNVTGAPDEDWGVEGERFPCYLFLITKLTWIVKEEVPCCCCWTTGLCGFGGSWRPFWIVIPGGSFCNNCDKSQDEVFVVIKVTNNST